MRRWRQEQREKVLRRFCRRAPYQTLDRRFRALLGNTLKRLGGIEVLAKMLAEEIKSVRANRPHDPFPLHALVTILRLQEFVETRPDAADAAVDDGYSGLSPAQIKARIRQSVIDLIREEPEIVVEAVETLGWTVIPPC